MAILTPYITFRGNCREAMTFYRESFGGELSFQTVGETPAERSCPAGSEEQIMHAVLMTPDLIIMATDMIGPAGFCLGTNIFLSITCDTREQICRFFTGLARGGAIADQLSTRPWGAIFGVVRDKFGITWMLSYDEADAVE